MCSVVRPLAHRVPVPIALISIALSVSACAPKFNASPNLLSRLNSPSSGSAAQLNFKIAPAGAAASGVSFSTQPSVDVTDSAGNLVSDANNMVTLAAYLNPSCSNPASGALSASTNPVSAISGTASFSGLTYTGTIGTIYIGASSPGLVSICSAAIAVTAGPPAKLAFTTLSTSPIVNQCSLASVTVQDSAGNTATVTGSPITVNFTSTGSGAFYSDSACTAAQSSASIAVGQSTTSNLYYIDSVPETTTVNAGAPLLSAPSAQTVVNKLQLVLSYAQMTWTAGQCIQATVTSEDYNGVAMAVPQSSTISNGGNGYGGYSEFYTDSACTSPGNTVLTAGQSSISFYVADDHAETLQGWVAGTSTYTHYSNATGSVTVNPASPSAVVLTGPTFVTPGICEPYMASITDSYGNLSPITGSPLSVGLATGGSAQLFSDSGCSTSASSVSVGVGSSSQGFYAKDGITELVTLSASAAGYTGGNFNLDSTASSPLTEVATTDAETCVLISGGVKCWGQNAAGELGNGTTTPSLVPVQVIGLTSGVQQIVAGTGSMGPSSPWPFVCALKTDGTVWCWGDQGGSTPQEILVGGTPLIASQLFANYWTTMALTSSGALYSWNDTTYTTPTQVFASGVTSAAAGFNDFYCAVLSGGDLKCWGYNGDGEVGNGTTTNQSSPVQVSGLTSGIATVGLAYSSSCSVNSSGGVECWGNNNYNQLADGVSGGRSTTPVATVAPLTSGVASLVGGSDRFCALMNSGAVYCWGDGSNGALGNGVMGGVQGTPQLVLSSGATYLSTESSSSSTCAIVSGNLECWGANSNGQLGTQAQYPSVDVPVYPGSLE